MERLPLLIGLFAVFGCGDAECEGPVGYAPSALVGASPTELRLGMDATDRAALVELTGTWLGTPLRCSGTRVGPGWVLTASHCGALLRAGDLTLRRVDGSTLRPLGFEAHGELDLALVAIADDGRPGWLEPPAAKVSGRGTR